MGSSPLSKSASRSLVGVDDPGPGLMESRPPTASSSPAYSPRTRKKVAPNRGANQPLGPSSGPRVNPTDQPREWMAYATAKPSVVTIPTSLPPCSKASGIIVLASMVRIAPAANVRTNATVAGEESWNRP